MEVAVLLAGLVGASGWRQYEHLTKKVKKLARQCDRIANKKGPGYQERLKAPYGRLLEEAEKLFRTISWTRLVDLADRDPEESARLLRQHREWKERYFHTTR